MESMPTARSYDTMRLGPPPGLVEAHPALVPELGRIGEVAHQPFVQLERRTQLPPQQVHLRHRLEVEPAILAGLEREPVLPQRLVVIPLLPERQAEVEVSEGASRRRAGGQAGRGPAGWFEAPAPLPCPTARPPACPSSKRSSARFAWALASVGLSAMARLVASRAASCWPRSP